MPSWDIHVKWAIKYGVKRDIAEFVNKLIDDPLNVSDPELLVSFQELNRLSMGFVRHDWGKRSGAERTIVEWICKYLYKDETLANQCIDSIKIHHILDYIAHIRNPRNLARMIVDSEIFKATRGMSMLEKLQYTRETKKSPGYKELIEQVENEILEKLDEKAYKQIIIELLKGNFQQWEVSRELQHFIISYLDEILRDIDKWLGKKAFRSRKGQKHLNEYL